jgi:hypothetical protein
MTWHHQRWQANVPNRTWPDLGQMMIARYYAIAEYLNRASTLSPIDVVWKERHIVHDFEVDTSNGSPRDCAISVMLTAKNPQLLKQCETDTL